MRAHAHACPSHLFHGHRMQNLVPVDMPFGWMKLYHFLHSKWCWPPCNVGTGPCLIMCRLGNREYRSSFDQSHSKYLKKLPCNTLSGLEFAGTFYFSRPTWPPGFKQASGPWRTIQPFSDKIIQVCGQNLCTRPHRTRSNLTLICLKACITVLNEDFLQLFKE